MGDDQDDMECFPIPDRNVYSCGFNYKLDRNIKAMYNGNNKI